MDGSQRNQVLVHFTFVYKQLITYSLFLLCQNIQFTQFSSSSFLQLEGLICSSVLTYTRQALHFTFASHTLTWPVFAPFFMCFHACDFLFCPKGFLCDLWIYNMYNIYNRLFLLVQNTSIKLLFPAWFDWTVLVPLYINMVSFVCYNFPLLCIKVASLWRCKKVEPMKRYQVYEMMFSWASIMVQNFCAVMCPKNLCLSFFLSIKK